MRALGGSSSVSAISRAAVSSGRRRSAGIGVQRRHAGIADAALGLVDDALERQVVIALGDQAQIGHGIADFGALIEARAADHAIGQAQR